ncbi:MAG: DUF423 domain-containing protein [Armatimonadetes bacterium]|nr:DUF423 domain-containing protein [Armatimonadota bacterium]
MNRFCLISGAVAGCLAVVLGAFGAHGLKAIISADSLAIFETAVRYQMYHSMALLALAALPLGSRRLVGRLWVAGMVIFSGSLYVLAITGIKWMGAITPIGGVCFILGWARLAWEGWRLNPSE